LKNPPAQKVAAPNPEEISAVPATVEEAKT
jgi:hypothetical protein